MRKLILSLALVLTASLSVAAQDIIILRNSERIDARIFEVTSTEIAYTLAGDGSGQVFRLSVAEIASIMYGNGDEQAFNAEPKGQGTVSSSSGDGTGKLKFNPTPQGRERPFGISIGYTSKQMALGSLKVSMLSNEIGKSSPALMVGFYMAPEFKYGIGIQTGLYYELATYNGTYTGFDDYYNEVEIGYSNTEHTLSIPLRVQYRYEILKDLSVFAYTGPSFDVSVEYKTTIDMKETLTYYEEYTDIRRFNLLWGVGIGVRYNCVQLMMGGDWGLIDILKSTPAKLNKPFFVTLSYVF